MLSNQQPLEKEIYTIPQVENQSAYRQILKATSLFGGVQVYNIAINVVRSKVVAILIGPTGMGIIGLFMSTISLIQRTTNMGLNISAVRDLAAAKKSNKPVRISRYYKTLNRMILTTGLLGAAFTLVFSSWLSQITFGNNDYELAFVWLSLSILFTQLSSGNFTILQGLRELKSLAKANVIGGSVGLIIGVPLYYFYKIDAIVPNILIGSLGAFIFSWFYVNRINIYPLRMSIKRTFITGRKMLFFGFILNITAMITLAQTYILRLYISISGSLEQVGLYTAGVAILNQYVGMIFTAMSTDYYPRLAGVAHDRKEFNQTVNFQTETALLIITPIIVIFMVCVNYVLILLYSNKFIPANKMLLWMALGIVPKTISWTLSLTIMAKGDSKIWFWSELISAIYVVGLHLIGYKLFGLTGIGIAFFIGIFLYTMQVLIIARKKYFIFFERDCLRLIVLSLLFSTASFGLVSFSVSTINYVFALGVFILSAVFSYYEMNKRIDLKDSLNKYFLKKDTTV